jgi:hypothetical protein
MALQDLANGPEEMRRGDVQDVQDVQLMGRCRSVTLAEEEA